MPEGLDASSCAALRAGMVIPAHPLALQASGRLDEVRQRGLTCYYLDAGVGGVAVGVHTTQFAIHDPAVGLYRPVLQLAAEELGTSPLVRVAGVLGPTERAVREAETAASLGYQLALVAGSSWGSQASDEEVLAGLAAVGEVLPIFGFYLQPAVGGRVFDYPFWRRFFELPAVRAVKIAPFDRYRTLDVVRALADSGRAGEVAVYTGNDDSIVTDLLTPYPGGVRVVGGLLGQFAVWAAAAVVLHRAVRELVEGANPVPPTLLRVAAELTDANAAIFDAAHGFAGCIPGIHEVLRREGVLAGRWCLDPAERLSPGQCAEIDRVWRAYPHLREPATLRELLSAAGP